MLKKSREPCIFGILYVSETVILVRLFMLDHEGGMVVVARLYRLPISRELRPVNLDQDKGRVPVKPLPLTSNPWRFVKLPKTSSGPIKLVFVSRLIYVNLVIVDHASGIVPVILSMNLTANVSRSVRDVKEAGKGCGPGRVIISNSTPVMRGPVQFTPNGAGMVLVPGHGHELSYVVGAHVESAEGLPSSV